jgi:hypothetical protein
VRDGWVRTQVASKSCPRAPWLAVITGCGRLAFERRRR